jgi:hypothetical protein
VIGHRFTVAKRHVALLCVGLCMALSAQMTVAVLDRLQHTFRIEHAPNGLAGPVFDHGHHVKQDVLHLASLAHEHDDDVAPASSDDAHDVQPGHGEAHSHDAVPAHGHPHAHDDSGQAQGFHTHDWLPQGHDHGPITHHHHGSGVLTPWLVSAPLQLAVLPVTNAVFHYDVTGHPDAPAWRRDRPPKLNLERVV